MSNFNRKKIKIIKKEFCKQKIYKKKNPISNRPDSFHISDYNFIDL